MKNKWWQISAVLLIAILFCSCGRIAADNTNNFTYSVPELLSGDSTDKDIAEIEDKQLTPDMFYGVDNSDSDSNTDSETIKETPYSGWSDWYNGFANLSDESFDKLCDAAKKNEYYGSDLMMLLLGNTELALCRSFFTENADTVQMLFEMLDYSMPQYTENGNKATIRANTPDNKKALFILEYDGNNTAQLTYDLGGETQYILSICITDTYWAKLYRGIAMPCEVHAICYKNGDICMDYSPEDFLDNDMTLFCDAALAQDKAFGNELDRYIALTHGVIDAK